jgi:hypothetical protein
LPGCFEYTFINESLPTDSISIVLFLIGFSKLIKLLSTKDFSIKKEILVSFLLFLPCFFRYNYPAISLAAIVGVLFIGYIKKDTLLKEKAGGFLCLPVYTRLLFLLL